MQYAIVNNIKSQAQKGLKGICTYCGAELIAKCGDKKINHWSHKGIRHCDLWWENETEWHRNWKNEFSNNWQEISLIDKSTNEKHIADILTSQNLVIEFQNSPLNKQELKSRENFYRNLTWVVNGSRLENFYKRFAKGFGGKRFSNYEINGIMQKDIFSIFSPDEIFPNEWLDSKTIVVFDFQDKAILNENYNLINQLFYIIPENRTFRRSAIMVRISRTDFIEEIINGEWKNRLNRPLLTPTNSLHSRK